MATVDLLMPRLGESVMEATILKWLKQVGDPVKLDETIVEIATDKVDTEVLSTAEGVIEEILFQPNDVVPVNTVIAKINTNTHEYADDKPSPVESPLNNTTTPKAVDTHPAEPPHEAPVQTYPVHNQSAAARFYSPLVLTIASNENIGMAELENIPGTGSEGRVTKSDILNYVANRHQTPQPTEPEKKLPVVQTASITPSITLGNHVEVIEMDRMRKLIADHMVRSKQTSPHVTSFSEADVTNMVLWRNRIKNEFEKREGVKITFTPLIISAIIKCIKKYPLINSSLDGDKIIIKKNINIGMATALPSGNLIVPVIKNADQLSLTGLTHQVNQLADAARKQKLKADDTQAGTFTFTNVGTFGSLTGTPIINQPQVAILAAGIIKKRPVVVETEYGDTVAIRHMMYLSMSYDHRIIDGSLGASFLTAVANELENFSEGEL